MNCTINDLNLSFDKYNRLRKTIGRVTGWDVNKAYIFAALLKNKDFHEYLLSNITEDDFIKKEKVDINNITEKDFADINQNKFGSILNAYYLKTYFSVNNTKTNKAMGRLMGFSSSTAKKIAKDYIADKLIDIYQKELNKSKEKRRSSKEIITEVKDTIRNEFIKRADDFAVNIVGTDKYSKEAKKYATKYLSIIKKINSLVDKINNDVPWLTSIQAQLNTFKNRKLTNAEIKEYNKLNALFKEKLAEYDKNIKIAAQYKRDRRIMAVNLIDLYSSNIDGELNVRNRNFSNLYMQIIGNPNEFFFEVYHTKKMVNLIKEYNRIGDVAEYIEEEDSNNDTQDIQYNDKSVDETAKTWEDSGYKNFNQTISTKMKFILSRIPKLESLFNSKDDVQAVDTNNELGVGTYYDPQYLTVQIYSFGDFTDVNSMIESLELKAKNTRALYGLGAFTNMLKKDRELANYVYVNFAKVLVNKVMVTINDSSTEGVTFDYSNPNAFNEVKLGFELMNNLRFTYNDNYSATDAAILKSLTTNTDLNYIRDVLQQMIVKYFPNFDKNSLDSLFNVPNNKPVINNVIQNIIDIVKGVGNIKANINAAYKNVSEQNKKALEEWEIEDAEARKKGVPESEMPKKPVKQEVDTSIRNLTPAVNKAIIKFANTISKYNESKARINSANAEGSTASDVIKNCFVTRFFDMILAETKEDSAAGLKAFGEYLIQGTNETTDNQYSNNPIFFGLKDEHGKIISPGMFTKTPTGFIINGNPKDGYSYAKNILKYALFDGVKNSNTSIGKVYSKMSKIDFFVTSYIMFNNSLIQHSVEGDTKQIGNLDTAVYNMRIGSDAPKIFTIRAPKYNRQQLEYAFFNHFLDEMNMFVQGINNIFTNKDGEFITRTDLDGLIGRAYFNERTADEITSLIAKGKHDNNFTEAIVKDGKLVGNMFKFVRLFDTTSYKFGEELEKILSLYGGVTSDRPALFVKLEDGRLKLNKDYINKQNSFIILEGNKIKLNLSTEQRTHIMGMVRKWMNAFIADSQVELANEIKNIQDQGISYTKQSMESYLLNTAVMNMNYDDMFEGDFKYYNNARDFLKRTKETQAGGESYENTSALDSTNKIEDVIWDGKPAIINIKQAVNGEASAYTLPVHNGNNIDSNRTLVARTGWRAVTVYNTIKPAEEAAKLQETLEKQFIAEGQNKEKAHNRSVQIAKAYWDNTIVNDAQSYITFEEFIRRKDADGTLRDYQDLIAQILDPNVSAEELNLDEINARIQVQKNFYFDKVFDADTNQFIPRQIKNAEFVLIPKLLPKDSDLIKIYEWMKKNDIGQLNTAEADKAAKKNIFTIWDKDTGEFNDKFEDSFEDKYVQTYKYKYLYKQQDVPQHIFDEENKFGSQLSKKIIDNVSTAPERVRKWADEYQDAYTENIKESFMNFISAMGWELDKSGKLVNAEYATKDIYGNDLDEDTIKNNRETLNLSNYLIRARQEAVRLGLDSNFMDYITTDEFGNTLMPSSMNNIQSKLESVGQALFNKTVSRQTLPGWHAAQITRVGYAKNLRFDAETGVMEVYLPRWSKLIPKGKTPEENKQILEQLEKEGLTIHLAYRIPTEGKQSINVIKVVGFTNEALGSTIVVPDAFVTQTGSDFDVDSIYGVCWEMYHKKNKNGTYNVYKISYEEDTVDDRMLYIKHINNKLNTKVKRNDLGEEIHDSIKELKDKISDSRKKGFDEEFDKIDGVLNKLYREKLPNWARGIIADVNKFAKTKAKKDNIVVDLTDYYPTIEKQLLDYLDKHNISDKEDKVVKEYIDLQTTILNIINSRKGIYTFNTEDYFSEKTDTIQQTIENNINNWLKKVEDVAIEAELITFEEFKKLPFVQRLDRKARNNYILDRMINIMNDSSSREEQYGRSQFDDIIGEKTSANNIIDNISNTSKTLISPYNPITQINYFSDVTSGAKLKARSVLWDTTLSKSNRVHGYLSEEHSVQVILNVDGNSSANGSAITYDENDLNDAYKEDIIPYEKPKYVDNMYDDIKENYTITMNQSYRKEKRSEIKANTTIEAIINGERTATTRYAKDGHIDYLRKFKVGDIIKFVGKNGEIVMVKVTKPLTKLPINTSAETWSKKEGWSTNYFYKVIKPQIERGEAYQFEYEYISPNSKSQTINTNIKSVSQNKDIIVNNRKQLLFTANKFGWSNNNKNIVGRYVTTYSAETTAHHLDAVKRGSIPNINDYTFDIYKFLTCIGLDYEFSIGFVRQPIISRLVDNYNLSNSVYFKNSSNPIAMTIADIAADLQLNYIRGKNTIKIDKTTSMSRSLQALKEDEKFVEAFNNIFSVNLAELSNTDIIKLKFPLNKDFIFQRIKTAANNKTNNININDGTAYNQAAVDLAMLLTFRNIQQTTNHINNIIQFTSVDKNGAEPSVRDTRLIQESIDKYRTIDVLKVGNKTWADSIFPLDVFGNVMVNDSTNKPIAAAYAYSTLPSIQVGKRMFITENDDYIDAENNIQKIIGRRFNNQEYKEWRTYGMQYLYNSVNKLLSPLMVDERGTIMEFIDETEKGNTEAKTNTYWNSERSRIFGYGIISESKFTVKDINDPTNKELAEYIKLTPAQKVIFIQRNFVDNPGIFKYIKVMLLNTKDIKNKGISRQYLSYDDQVDNIDDLYQAFINSFSNHNPLIKLATIDLIKYAFIAEGYNYRSSYINKIIPNSVLYEDVNNGCLDIIHTTDIRNGINVKLNELPYIQKEKEYIDLFVRSHSELIPIKNIGYITYRTDYEGNDVPNNSKGSTFKKCTRPDKLVVLDNTSENIYIQQLIEQLDLKNKVNGYIRVDMPIDAKKRDLRLYRVVGGNPIKNEDGTVDSYKEFYLIPLNILEKNEVYEASYTKGNNRFNDEQYYIDKIKDIEYNIEINRTDKNAKKDVSSSEYAPIGDYKTNISLEDVMKDKDALQQLASSLDEFIKGGARMLLMPITNILLPRVLQGNYSSLLVLNNNSLLEKYIPKGKAVTQTVQNEEGESITVTIANLPLRGRIRSVINNVMNNIATTKNEYIRDEYEYVIRQLKDTNTSVNIATIYRISINKTTEEKQKDIIRNAESIMINDDSLDNIDRTDIIGESALRGRDIDNVSSAIIKQITYDARKNNNSNSVAFVRNIERKGVNKNFRASLIEHKGDIYKAAARYYQSAANNIINKINKFNFLGVDYDMSEEKLYEILAENPEYFPEVANLILDAVTFGNRIDLIFSLDISAEDKEVKDNIESIRHSINSIRTNTKVKDAMGNLINIYFKRYSSNPLITEGLMEIRDQFGDIDTMAKLISDPTEINNTEVQVILKQVYTMFNKAEMFETKRNVQELQDEFARIDSIMESLDMNKVIDYKTFRLQQEYNDSYVQERTRLINEYNDTKIHKFDSVQAFGEYLKAQYALDEFMYKHTEQPIVAEYYEEDLNNRSIALENGGNSYVEYRMLSAQLYEEHNSNLENDEEAANRITNIKNRMSYLKRLTNSVGEEKSEDLKKESKAITDFINNRIKINKKYFDKQEYDGFREVYQRYSSFIKSYDRNHTRETLEEKLENVEYKEAYDWIKNNGHVGFTKEASDKLSDAFETLTNRKTAISNRTKIRLMNIPGAIDDSGLINPTVLTDAQIKLLRDEQQSELATRYENGEGEIILIKDVPSNIPLMKKKKNVKYKRNIEKERIIGRINEIISKVTDKDTGRIDMIALCNNNYITDFEREELIRLYEELYAIGVDNSFDKGISYDWLVNDTAYNEAMNYYRSIKNTKQGKQLLKIITHLGIDGNIHPNLFLYGYKMPFSDFIDTERTEALNFIKDNVEFIPTEYYYQSLRKATEEGRYEEWFRLNHVYNPVSHKYEPLNIWTTIQAKPNSYLDKEIDYIPSFDNIETSVKGEYVNKKYKEFSSNYKRGDTKYDSSIVRNKKEQEMYDLIQRVLNKYATTYQGKRFVGQGYLPRERESQINGKWVVSQVAALLGASWYSNAESDSFHETVDYTHDRDANMNMLEFIKTKGSKQYIKIPNRADFKTDKEYRERLNEVREENRKITEENRALDNNLINKDFRKIMEDFVYNATIFNSRQAAKPYLYLLLEDLAVNKAYMIKGMWNSKLVKDYDTSTKDDIQYRKISQNNARELVHNLARRLLYDQYHEKSTMRSIANFMQNLTSAKYMVFNLYGGIANITTGKVNIGMEQLANEYFGTKEFMNAERKYLSKSLSFIASAYSDQSPNLTVALCKEFKVIDFDQILQFGATSENLDATMRKVRNFMYSFQSGGEHFMQNSVLLAMLASNRIYVDNKGNYRIGDFKDYTMDIEYKAMQKTLAGNEELLKNYEIYRKNIGIDNVKTRLDIASGRKDINRNFLYSLRDNVDENINSLYRSISKQYHKNRESLLKEAREKFNTKRTLESFYEFKDGKASIKQELYDKLKGNVKDPQNTIDTLVAEFREKVISVNKKIHGVYDKNGAAFIESKWWGSLVMQYHKHLYNGIYKRWRRLGFFSEFRGSMERGTYQTLIDFLGTEFTNFKDRRKAKQENGTNIALASIQVAIESAINTITNINFNWNNLSIWEKANIRRNHAEVVGVLVACLVVMALYGLSDDDDINDDRFKASLLYLADRLYSETTMYGPQGLISEAKTNWSQPVASLAGINDLTKAITLIPQALFDPNYNPEYQSGRYSGMNKFEVLLKRNTVGLRNLDRVLTIDKNNNYYKLEKSQIGISAAKSFGDIIAGR